MKLLFPLPKRGFFFNRYGFRHQRFLLTRRAFDLSPEYATIYPNIKFNSEGQSNIETLYREGGSRQMKRILLAMLALGLLLIAIGCPPSGKTEDAFGPGPDREPVATNGDEEPAVNGDANGDVVEEGDGEAIDTEDGETEEPGKEKPATEPSEDGT